MKKVSSKRKEILHQEFVAMGETLARLQNQQMFLGSMTAGSNQAAPSKPSPDRNR